MPTTEPSQLTGPICKGRLQQLTRLFENKDKHPEIQQDLSTRELVVGHFAERDDQVQQHNAEVGEQIKVELEKWHTFCVVDGVSVLSDSHTYTTHSNTQHIQFQTHTNTAIHSTYNSKHTQTTHERSARTHTLTTGDA